MFGASYLKYSEAKMEVISAITRELEISTGYPGSTLEI